jgi:hypothetical protein
LLIFLSAIEIYSCEVIDFFGTAFADERANFGEKRFAAVLSRSSRKRKISFLEAPFLKRGLSVYNTSVEIALQEKKRGRRRYDGRTK